MQYIEYNPNTLNIVGARRNPELNPKSTKFDFQYWVDKELSLNKEISTYYISFTDILKIGINPSNKFKTPLGIYSYPVRYIHKEFFEDNIPFASNRPYIQVLKLDTNKILFGNNYSKYKLDFDINKLASKYDVSGLLVQLEHKSPIFDIWNLTRLLAIKYKKKDYTITWNGILRYLGYEVAVDNGLGFIHKNEPKQAVFLTSSAYKHVSTILNVRHKLLSKKPNRLLSKFINMSVDKYERYCSINPNITQLKGTEILITEEDNTLVIQHGILYCRNINNFIFKNSLRNENDLEYISNQRLIHVKSRGQTIIRNCTIYIGMFVNCKLINCIIYGGIFDNCEFEKSSWYEGSYRIANELVINTRVPYWNRYKVYSQFKDEVYRDMKYNGDELIIIQEDIKDAFDPHHLTQYNLAAKALKELSIRYMD